MSIFGVDISRYQGPEAMDDYSFAILNVEDPSVGRKVTHARELSIPWGYYSWVYPGRGADATERTLEAERTLGVPPLGHWFDYEEAGVSPNDLLAAWNHAQSVGLSGRVGTYTYLYLLESVRSIVFENQMPLWLAYYPGTNSGQYIPEMSSRARQVGAVIHQYTSTNGRLDVNVVLQEEWYQSFIGQSGMDAMSAQAEKDVSIIKAVLLGDGADGLFGFPPNESIRQKVNEIHAEVKGAPYFGIAPLLDRIQTSIADAETEALDPIGIAKAITDSLGERIATEVADEIKRRLEA